MDPIPTSTAPTPAPTTTPHADGESFVPPKKKSGGGKKALLVILILLLIGGAGFGAWYYQQRKIDDLNKQITTLKAEADKPADVEKTNVILVSPPDGTYTANLPEGWVFGLCAGNDVIFMAPNAGLLGKCSTEKGGTVMLSRAAGTAVSPESEFSTGTADLTYNTVTVAGLSGIKVTYTVTAGGAQGYPPAGTKVVKYETVQGGQRYTFTYHQLPGDPDNAAAFDDIVSSIVIP